MSNLSYWEKRFLQTKSNQLKSTEEYERALQPQLKGLQHELDIEMNKYYRRYSQTNDISEDETRKILNNIGNSNWKMTLDQFKQKAIEGGHQNELDSEYFKSRIARLQNLESQLKQRTGNFAKGQQDSMKDALSKQYGESYMRTIFNSQSAHFSYTGNFAHINDNQLRAIVSKPWKGSNFSKRIWNNYQKELPDKLMDSILRGSLMGYHPSKISRMMHAKFQDVSKKDIHRLVTTEFGHVNEEATAQGYEESGIDEYQYMATLESHTCMVCAHLDGQIFKLSDRKDEINYPTIHPYCRCTTVPYIADLPEVGERWMRDPETGEGKLTNNMSFKEWRKVVEYEHEEKLSAGTYGADLKYIRSKAFEDKINSNEKLTRIGSEITKLSRKIVQHRNGTPFEDYYLLDMETGKTVALSNKATKTKGVVYNNQIINAFASGADEQYVSIHNHPSGYPPSLSDIATLSLESKNNSVGLGLTVGHDGSVYWYTKANKKFSINSNNIYEQRIKKYLQIGYNEVASQELSLKDFEKIYEFKFGRLDDVK